MASLQWEAGKKRWKVQVCCPNGRRPSLYLKGVSESRARQIVGYIEELAAAIKNGRKPDEETLAWVELQPERARARLEKLGLVEKRPESHSAVTLKEWIDRYIETRSDVKPSTRLIYDDARQKLLDYFGEDRQLRSITAGDADEFRLHLVGLGLAENTVRRRTGIAKQFFRAAVRKKVIADNPFADQKTCVHGNDKRKVFIDRETIQKVIDQTPDREWKLLIALARFGGLRTPSESLALRIADVDWDGMKITVRSSKTERFEDKATRTIPLFPELEDLLLTACTDAKPGDEFVIRKHRDTRANLRTQFCRIIRAAKLEPWTRPFHNLRASRQTELAETFPGHVVCTWMGNSQAVAQEHYLTVTPEHFRKARGGAAEGTKKVVQKVVHSPAPPERMEQNPTDGSTPENRVCDPVRGGVNSCDNNGLGESWPARTRT
ncbi:MAG: tyrosine-type recombinase/integrase [Planctomycetes bacterium]|nr:tyrosine-type recombinase/integrase [Planctomycetota bacterium]